MRLFCDIEFSPLSLSPLQRWALPLFSSLALAGSVLAQVPHMLDYQGRVAVNGANFDGTGQFKFALVDAAGTTTYWSHDGTSSAGSPPASFLSIPITKGLYAVRLGDVALANMSPLTPSVLAHPDVRLRVWFNDGANGFQHLQPDRRIAAVAYALLAEDVPPGSISTEELADGAVTSAKLAPGSVTIDKLAPGVGGGAGAPGTLVVSPNPDDAALLDQGYTAIHTYPGGTWENSAATGAPSGRRRHTAVWTGSALLAWGGEVGGGLLSQQGGLYQPASGTWTLLPVSQVSPARADHTAVWTGERMIVWGGLESGGLSGTGAIYDPAAQAWRATPTSGAPVARTGHSAVWTGTEMIIWGGSNASGAVASGGSYTPPPGSLGGADGGSWTTLPTTGAPSARRDHVAVWDAGRMYIWGGETSTGGTLSDGAVYTAATGTWAPLPASPLSPRLGATAAAIDGRLIIFGGAATRSGADLADGAIFNPANNTWTLLPALNAPTARRFAQGVTTGSELLILGGELGNGQVVLTGGAYHPGENRWRALPAQADATSRETATWLGNRVAVFGLNGLRLLDPKPAVTLYGKF